MYSINGNKVWGLLLCPYYSTWINLEKRLYSLPQMFEDRPCWTGAIEVIAFSSWFVIPLQNDYLNTPNDRKIQTNEYFLLGAH